MVKENQNLMIKKKTHRKSYFISYKVILKVSFQLTHFVIKIIIEEYYCV